MDEYDHRDIDNGYNTKHSAELFTLYYTILYYFFIS
jgi:hypothetical protein